MKTSKEDCYDQSFTHKADIKVSDVTSSSNISTYKLHIRSDFSQCKHTVMLYCKKIHYASEWVLELKILGCILTLYVSFAWYNMSQNQMTLAVMCF